MGANTQPAVKAALGAAYATACPWQALYSTPPGTTSGGVELAGGSPAYARRPATWSTGGTIATTGVFNCAAGSTVAGTGLHTAATGGSYQDGAALTPVATFSSQGTYSATLTVAVA